MGLDMNILDRNLRNAQSNVITNQAAKIAELEAVIDALNRKIAEMERATQAAKATKEANC